MIIAGNTTGSSGLTHLISVYYDRVGLSSLRKKFMFWLGVDKRSLPKKNGKTVQFFRWSELGVNTSATTEGAPQSSLELASTTVSATVAQYADFINFSDLLVDTAPDSDIVAVGADKLGYRAGLSCDTMIRNEIDSVAGSIDVSPLGDYFEAKEVAHIRAIFAGLDIQPFSGRYFRAIAHPYVTYDFVHDPAVGGFQDIVKQQANVQGHERLFSMEDRGFVARFGSFEVWESTNVTTVSGTPNKYRVYFFGEEGLAAIDLAGRGPTQTMNQDETKFSIMVQRHKPSVADPAGKIRASVAYNFVWANKILDTNPYRIRKMDLATSLGL